jgi:hypothetical protein
VFRRLLLDRQSNAHERILALLTIKRRIETWRLKMFRDIGCDYALSKKILEEIPQEKKFNFVYYTFSETLVGDLDGQSFVMRAVSGGGRGGKNPESSFASYSPHRATKDATKTTKPVRGGSLPPGLWRIEKPSLYAGRMGRPAAKLTPIGMQETEFQRDYKDEPFLIHGPGKLGSNGCIVIEKNFRKPLLDAVEKAGGAILLVSNITQPGDLLDKAQRRSQIA